MQDPLDQLITHSDLQDAQKHSREIRDRLEAETVESRKANNTFYSSLALFSGGTVALSITYLGYLRNTTHPVIHSRLIVASWACLLAAVPLSLFYPFLHNAYTYYARMAEYLNARAQQRISESEVALKLPVVNLPPDERESEASRRRNAADSLKKQAVTCRRWEEFYYFMSQWGGLASMLLFVVGLVLLFWFATSNMQ